MEVSRLGPGEIVAGVAGIVLIAAMSFLTWFGVEAPPDADPIPGYDAFRAFDVVDLLLLLTAVAAIALPLLTMAQSHTDVPITLSAFVVILGLISTLAVLFRIVDPPNLSGGRFVLDFAPLNTGVETTRGAGIFVGLLAVLGIVVGAWLSMRDERTDRAPGPA